VIPGVVDVLQARLRIRRHVDVTPLHRSQWLSDVAGVPVWLKLECVQVTGSFKIRGALNALMRLAATRGGPAEAIGPAKAGPCLRGEKPGVVTASAGNHGRAIALGAEMLGLRAIVFAPGDAPRSKLEAIRRHGAELRETASYDEAEAAAKACARDTGLPFISPYNHPDVIAGAGTIALEIFESLPQVRTIVVPIGGAGLISGVAIAARSLAPGTRIVGVEAEASTAFSQSVRNGRITTIEPGPTLADGLGGNMDPETVTFEIVRQHVDEIVTVTERELAEGLRRLAGEDHVVAEGAGAAAPAAVLAGKVRGPGHAVALVTGSNIDLERLRAVLTS
jgi:threonine dehydratase